MKGFNPEKKINLFENVVQSLHISLPGYLPDLRNLPSMFLY